VPRLYTFTEAGGHPLNEDAFLTRTHPTATDCQLVFLADGQGGRAGGARAALLACNFAARVACEHAPAELADSTVWQDLLSRADSAVAADPAAGFTTLIGFAVRDGYFVGASCGDSAVFVVSGPTAAEPTGRQFKNPPVGSGEADFIPFEMGLVRPWRVLAVSDGVWKYAGRDKLTAAARESAGEEVLARLQSAARLRGSAGFPDDFTVVLIEEPA
jgi:serine/threonine protein phosphatase PrpC